MSYVSRSVIALFILQFVFEGGDIECEFSLKKQKQKSKIQKVDYDILYRFSVSYHETALN